MFSIFLYKGRVFNKQKHLNNKGFALVATLSLLSLIVMIALAMMSLATVQSTKTIHNGARDRARANAKLALVHAIAELQRQLGSDQRISANGSILDDPNTVENEVLHSRWLGVWDSWKAGNATGDSRGESSHQTIMIESASGDVLSDLSMAPTYLPNRNDFFRRWLLSLNESDLTSDKATLATLPMTLNMAGSAAPEGNDSTVTLVGKGSLGTDSSITDHVNARLLLIKGNNGSVKTSGRYGWWIGDESQKATLMSDPFLSKTLTSADKIYRTQAPGSMGTKTIKGLKSLSSDKEIDKVATLKTADFLSLDTPSPSDSSTISEQNFHETTIYSKGLLVDVREGGLKRDLSTLLERPITRTEDGDEFMLYNLKDPRFPYPNSNNRFSPDHSRVPIQDLAAYYQMYDDEQDFANERREGTRYDSSQMVDSLQINVPDYAGGEGASRQDKQRFLREYTTLYRQPVITKVQFLVAVTAQPITQADRDSVIDRKQNERSGRVRANLEPVRNSDTHKLRLGIMPVITMWNPNNLPMVMDSCQILRFSTPPFGFRFRKYRSGVSEPVDLRWFNLNYAAALTGAGATTGQASGFTLLRLRFAHQNSSITLEPGEVKVFSLPDSTGATLNDDDGRSVNLVSEGRNMDVENGWDPFGFFLMPNSSPQGPYADEAPEAYAFPGVQRGECMVFNKDDSIALTIEPDNPERTATNSWRDGRVVSRSSEIKGAGFNLYMLDEEYQLNWRDGIDSFRHYAMISRHGGMNNEVSSQVAAFNKALITPGFPGGEPVVEYEDKTNAIKGEQLINASQLDEAITLFEFSLSLGGEAGPGSTGGFGGGRRITTRPFLHSAASAAPFIDQPDAPSLYNHGWDWQLGKVNTVEDSIVTAEPDTGRGFYGGGYTIEAGATHVVQREIPTLPLISLASLSHAHLGGFSLGYSNVVGDNPETDRLWFKSGRMKNPIGLDYQKTTATGQAGLGPHIVQAIGNSYAHPNIPAAKAYTTKTRFFDGDETPVEGVPFADHSYLANKALWDEFFFSTIAPQPAKIPLYDSTGLTSKELAEKFFFSEQELPNHRFSPYIGNLNQIKLDELYTEQDDFSDGLADKIASHLMVDGVFNINSTSEDAWKTFLSSLKGKPVAYLDGGAVPKEIIVEGTVFGPGSLTNSPPIKTADLTGPNFPPEQWKSGRELSDKDIEQLAKAIVKQVKLRGPFLSLSEFVNRRLDNSNLEFSLKGALQAALDDDDVDINANFRTSARMLDEETATISGFEFPDAANGPVAYGSAPYVDQADVLRHFASQLTPRGDTFIIRAYGDALDSDGNVVSRAWCEAIVQRVPEYIDPTDLPHEKHSELSDLNKEFGRKMKTISFRWLTASEI